MPQYIVRYERFIYARVLVTFQMDEGILRDALMASNRWISSSAPPTATTLWRNVQLLTAIPKLLPRSYYFPKTWLYRVLLYWLLWTKKI
jgi:hypothetical protein